MFENLYGNISNKAPKRNLNQSQEKSLEKALSLDRSEVDQDFIIKAYINEVKKLLSFNSALELIEGIHGIQSILVKIQDKYIGFELPNFHEFYFELSPLLLQKYWERGKNPDLDEPVDMIFLESIHIALEEEIYIWQEKIEE